MCFVNSPRGVTNNRSDGAQNQLPKRPSSCRVKDTEDHFKHGRLDEASVTYLRILRLFFVELTMSCYFKKLALPTTPRF
jgi:hypothetical protein